MFSFYLGGLEVCAEMNRKQMCLKKPAGPFIKGPTSCKINFLEYYIML